MLINVINHLHFIFAYFFPSITLSINALNYSHYFPPFYFIKKKLIYFICMRAINLQRFMLIANLLAKKKCKNKKREKLLSEAPAKFKQSTPLLRHSMLFILSTFHSFHITILSIYYQQQPETTTTTTPTTAAKPLWASLHVGVVAWTNKNKNKQKKKWLENWKMYY